MKEKEKSGYFIVGDIDRPSEKLLAKQIGNEIHYVHPSTRPCIIQLEKGDNARNHVLTPVEDFGVTVIEFEGEILGIVTGPSIAKYSHGEHRDWQGSKRFSFLSE